MTERVQVEGSLLLTSDDACNSEGTNLRLLYVTEFVPSVSSLY